MTRSFPNAATLALVALLAGASAAQEMLEYAEPDGSVKSAPVDRVNKEDEKDFSARIVVGGRPRRLDIPSRLVISFRRGDQDAANQWSKRLATGKRLLATGQLATQATPPVPGAEETFEKIAYSIEKGLPGEEEESAALPWHNEYALLYLIETRYQMRLQGDKAKLVQARADVLSTPMESLIIALGRGIGEAQAELDRNSIAVQRMIDEDPELSQYGLRATWYQMPRTELELKVAVTMENVAETQPQPSLLPTEGLRVAGLLPTRLWLQPVNAHYTNQFNYDVNASSLLKMTIEPVPPPGSEQVTNPTMSEADVRTLPEPFLQKEADGTTLLKNARLAVNFNPGARMWFVMQYREGTEAIETLALVKMVACTTGF